MQFAPGKSCDPLQADLSALQLANFIQTHEASTRALQFFALARQEFEATL